MPAKLMQILEKRTKIQKIPRENGQNDSVLYKKRGLRYA